MRDPLMKVGALAARTGLTIRTLHHYDEIGLLSPSARTPSGHRLYNVHDVARLQQIQALRSMGLSLDHVRETLRDATYSPSEIVKMQLARVEQQIAQQQQLVTRLQRLAQHLEAATELSLDELCQLIDAAHTMDKYFTPAQLTAMHERGVALGADQVRETQQEWGELIPAMRAHLERNTPVTDAAVQALARRWRELLQQFTGGDRDVTQRLQRMAEGEGAEGAPDAELLEYVGRVVAGMGSTTAG